MRNKGRYRIPNGDTARDLMQYIGQRATYYISGLEIDVEVLDARISWGEVSYLITPVAGSGSLWVKARLELKGRQP